MNKRGPRKVRRCSICNELKDYNKDFYLAYGRSYPAKRCKQCVLQIKRQWRIDNKDRDREQNRQYALRYHPKRVSRKYNIGELEYMAMEASQQGICLICQEFRVESRMLQVDHDHKTGRVRGLLCGNCNSGIGQFGDNASLLLRAALYLRRNDAIGSH